MFSESDPYYCILLLRGINVGGPTRSLPMKELVVMLESLHCSDIRTYIQSGNVVMKACDRVIKTLPTELSNRILAAKKFSPQIQILSTSELEQTIASNPFSGATNTPALLHIGFLAQTPEQPDLETLYSLTVGEERIQLIGKRFYHFAANGYGRSKVAEKAERLLGVPMTDRNWNTVMKLRSMLP